MEIGVRVQKEIVATGQRTYVAHSYLTFVGLPRAPRPVDGAGAEDNRPALGIRVGSQATSSGDDKAEQKPRQRVKLAPIIPSNTLEARRHLLAGRRRETRMRAARAASSSDISQSGISSALRDEIRFMRPSVESNQAGTGSSSGAALYHATSPSTECISAEAKAQAQRVEMLELELVTRAVASSDPSVRIVPSSSPEDSSAQVIVNLPGDEPIVHTWDEVQECASRLGLDISSLSTDSNGDQASDEARSRSESQHGPLWTDWQRRMSVVQLELSKIPPPPEEIAVESTLVQSLNLVFPQHANSVSVLFGGQLAEWLEETALLSVRHLRGSWHTVSMDGLPFKEGVAIGEVMNSYAVVTDIWHPPSDSQSALAEVLVIAEAEAPDGSRRITNEALFTLRSERVPGLQGVKRVVMPPGSELERFAAIAHKRRLQRLERGNLLVRLYSK